MDTAVLFIPPVRMATLLAFELAGAVFLFLLLRKWRRRETWSVVSEFRAAHLVQSAAQSAIYVYVSFYYAGIGEHAPLILIQLVYAHAVYFLVTLNTEQKIRLNFSMFPIVLSINLFIWFWPAYFAWHLILVAAAILAKTYWVREVNGKTSHIFNPSALVMAAAAVAVIAFQRGDVIRSVELVRNYPNAPHILMLIFVVGSISQWFGRTQFVAFGSYLGLILVISGLDFWAGESFLRAWLSPSVFIGITLLVTDPQTSPKNQFAQLIFGFIYGVSIWPLLMVLSLTGNRTLYDKILIVPLLNYLAPYLDRWVGYSSDEKGFSRAQVLAAYAAVFLTLYPVVLSRNGGKGYWEQYTGDTAID